MLAKNDSELQNAYKYLEKMSADEKERMVYEAREAWLLDKRTIEFFAHKEGLEQGIEQGKAEGKAEGIAEGKMETALNALHEGLVIEIITRLTGLSEDEIKKLADRLKQPNEK